MSTYCRNVAYLPTPETSRCQCIYLLQKLLAASKYTHHRNTLLPGVCTYPETSCRSVYIIPTAEIPCCQCIYLPQKHLAASVFTDHKNILLPVYLPTTETPCCYCVYLPQETSCRCVLLPQEQFTTPQRTYHRKHLAAGVCYYHKNILLHLCVPTTGNILLPVATSTPL